MAKAASNTSPEYAAKVALYEKLVATNPAVERKGATMPYTSVSGHMFSVLDKTGTLALRLAPAPSPRGLGRLRSPQLGLNLPRTVTLSTTDLNGANERVLAPCRHDSVRMACQPTKLDRLQQVLQRLLGLGVVRIDGQRLAVALRGAFEVAASL